ncbi:MAG: Rhs element Vgr protein [Saprospiraceae bacterium]|jgi:Rhs element Vgr protein
MASPLVDQKTDLISYEVKVNGKSLNDQYYVYSIEVDKEVNRISTAEVCILDGNLSKEEFKVLDTGNFKPGSEVEIHAGYHQKNEVIFKGIVVKTGVRIKHRRHSLLYIECADKAIKTTMGRHSEYYTDKKDSDIIHEVLGNYAISKDVETTKITHKKIIQYNSTDWDFVVSRAEVNGRIVITDDNEIKIKKPKTSGEEIELTFGTDMIKTDLYLDGHYQYPGVEASAWDMSKNEIVKSRSSEPGVNRQGDVSGKDMASKLMKKDFKIHLTGPLEKDDLKEWANAKLMKARFGRIRGSLKFQGHAKVKPDTLIKITKVGKHFDGQAYISGIHHEIKEGNWTSEAKVGLDPEWFSETKPQVNSSAAAGLLPGIQGIFIGTVQKLHQDPDGETRVLVDIPVIEPSGAGVWARLANLYAGNKRGTFFMPEVDDEVILGFLQGDPRFPVILGSLYSKKHKPPYTPDEKNTIQAIVTRNNLKIIFEDDKKNIIVETPGGNRLILSDEDKKVTIENPATGGKNTITMQSSGLKLDSPGSIEITAGKAVKITSKMGNVEIKAAATAKVKGMKVDISATTEASINGGGRVTVKGAMAELNGTGPTTIKGLPVMIN